jgi:hypothetical protein
MAIIINGRRIDPSSIGNGVRGSELIAQARASHGRRPIIESGAYRRSNQTSAIAPLSLSISAAAAQN